MLDHGVIIAHGPPKAIQNDPKVITAYLGCEVVAKVYAVVEDRACRKILLSGCDDDPEDLPAPGGPGDEAEAPLPFDLAEVNGEFRAIAEEECARIRPLLARHEEEERDNRDDLPRRVSFDDSAEGERVHRYQAHWSRTLLRTLAELRNHRELPEPEARLEPTTGAVPPSPSVELPAPQLDVAVPSSSASSPQPVPVIPPPVEDPAGLDQRPRRRCETNPPWTSQRLSRQGVATNPLVRANPIRPPPRPDAVGSRRMARWAVTWTEVRGASRNRPSTSTAP